jgi:hypothetical protein
MHSRRSENRDLAKNRIGDFIRLPEALFVLLNPSPGSGPEKSKAVFTPHALIELMNTLT